jgi:plasmid stabilization system protein ParE
MAVRWADSARADFLHAVEVSLDTFGSGVADRLIDRVERRLVDVAAFPAIGQEVSGAQSGERVVRAGVFRIVYRPQGDDILIVAFLHGARDSLFD